MVKDTEVTESEYTFLEQSNFIEEEYSKEALEDAINAWEYAKKIKTLSIKDILEIHKRLMKRLNPRIAGKIRDVPVYIGGEKRDQTKKEIEEELRLLCNPGIYPILSEELIKRWHIKFEKIHPFSDGNGRTGRILLNIQRLSLNLPLLIIRAGNEQQEYYKWFKEIK